jgi:carboxyl-terminal processing protease
MRRQLLPTITFTKFVPTACLLIAGLLISTTNARPQQAFKRDRALQMLSMIQDDVKKHYYDATFHGVNFDQKVSAAKEKIKGASSENECFAIIADVLDSLNDSHTFFIPPPRPYSLEYGYRTAVIGDEMYITQVKPGSDAAAKNVKPGDKVMTINTNPAVRETDWKLGYMYHALSPRPALRLELISPDGQRRQVDVKAEITQGKHVFDFNDLYMYVQHNEKPMKSELPQWEVFGEDLIIMRLPDFGFPPTSVDDLMGKIHKEKNVIFDLRGNPGGRVDTLTEFLRRFFDHEVPLDTRVTRKGNKVEVIKGFGGRTYEGKVFILVDAQSSSAAEIFARVMQLEKRGTVLGDRSSGYVMEAEEYEESSGIDVETVFGVEITDADLLMKDGKSLEHTGVTPDTVLVPTGADIAAGRDPVLAAAAQMVGVKISPEQAFKIFPFEWPKPPVH